MPSGTVHFALEPEDREKRFSSAGTRPFAHRTHKPATTTDLSGILSTFGRISREKTQKAYTGFQSFTVKPFKF
jgi:hypothetical protein